MTRNRKADLQRKLTMAPVAKPPAGLADRIKHEIPQHFAFQTGSEGTSARKFSAFNLRIAASIILLVSSVYLALHLVSRNGSNLDTRSIMANKNDTAPAPKPVAVLPSTPPAPGSARVQEPADLPPLPRVPPPASIAAQPPRERIAQAKREEAVSMTNGAPVYIADAGRNQPVTESTPIVNPIPPAAMPLPAAPPPEAPVLAEGGAPAREGAMAKTSAANAASESRDALAVPPVRKFYAIQSAIAHGDKPLVDDLDE